VVFVDTSVWIDFFRGRTKTVQALSNLLDERLVALATPVWLELLSGAKKSEFTTLARVLSALPRYTPSEATWSTCEQWVEVAVAKGKRFGIPDLLIAATCSQHEGALWSIDKDFNQMSTLGFVKLWK
jgi:predicted nucleic acid-binding protein